MEPNELLVTFAAQFIGVKESGHNAGAMVEKFQRAVDGKAEGEPWCAAFVQFCLKEVDKILGTKTAIYPSEHCLTIWNRTNEFYRAEKPEKGCLIIWHKFKNGMGTGLGHIGIVAKVLDQNTVETIEGNTSDALGMNRDGDGVFWKKRNIAPRDDFRVVGFLRCWNTETIRLT